MKISTQSSILSARSLDFTLFLNECSWDQMRAQRAGRGRLVTVQAEAKNWTVLSEWKAALAAVMMVNNVFNFFLSI